MYLVIFVIIFDEMIERHYKHFVQTVSIVDYHDNDVLQIPICFYLLGYIQSF